VQGGHKAQPRRPCRRGRWRRVPESKVGKNRMHMDIVTEDVEAEVERLEAHGARRLHGDVRSLGHTRWVTMADPEDNEFCVSTGVDW